MASTGLTDGCYGNPDVHALCVMVARVTGSPGLCAAVARVTGSPGLCVMVARVTQSSSRSSLERWSMAVLRGSMERAFFLFINSTHRHTRLRHLLYVISCNKCNVLNTTFQKGQHIRVFEEIGNLVLNIFNQVMQ